MHGILPALVVAGLFPLGLAFWANRRTSLAHALVWAGFAWVSWALALFFEPNPEREIPPGRYCALALTACAGVAVLGARRPHVGAWNFVVLGLLAVMLLPLGEMLVLRTRSAEGLRTLFFAMTIAVVTLNYLPTRLAPAALILMMACEAELYAPYDPALAEPTWWLVKDGVLASVPWIAWIAWRTRGNPGSGMDRLWLDFRDRWGFVWSQRMREQFNSAARNAGWMGTLAWTGLADGDSPDEDRYLQTLRSLLQRFLEPDQKP